MTALIIWNFITFIIYGFDKYKAIRQQYRISERALITLAIFGGGLGALISSHIFRHKTKQLKFQIILPLGAIITIVFFLCL